MTTESLERQYERARDALRWTEQLETARRHCRRFQRWTEGAPWHGEPCAELMDDVRTFFLHCYHVKDWVIARAELLDLTRQEIEDFVTRTPALALCADICNGLKHLELQRTRNVRQPAIVGHESNTEFVRTSEATAMLLLRIRVTIDDGVCTYDAFEVATNAVRAWDTFLGPRLRKQMRSL